MKFDFYNCIPEEVMVRYSSFISDEAAFNGLMQADTKHEALRLARDVLKRRN